MATRCSPSSRSDGGIRSSQTSPKPLQHPLANLTSSLDPNKPHHPYSDRDFDKTLHQMATKASGRLLQLVTRMRYCQSPLRAEPTNACCGARRPKSSRNVQRYPCMICMLCSAAFIAALRIATFVRHISQCSHNRFPMSAPDHLVRSLLQK